MYLAGTEWQLSLFFVHTRMFYSSNFFKISIINTSAIPIYSEKLQYSPDTVNF
jgi:hypothetical protein